MASLMLGINLNIMLVFIHLMFKINLCEKYYEYPYFIEGEWRPRKVKELGDGHTGNYRSAIQGVT